MKILARRLLLGMVFIVMLFCTSLTAFADGTGAVILPPEEALGLDREATKPH